MLLALDIKRGNNYKNLLLTIIDVNVILLRIRTPESGFPVDPLFNGLYS